METHTISIDFPEEILLALNESETEFKHKIKVSLAIRLYKTEKLTIGKASQLSGMSRLEFENILSESETSISNLTIEDILSDISKIK
jgi:predicted HTH domain antitoxin